MRQRLRLPAAAVLAAALLLPTLAAGQVNSVRGPLQGPLVPPVQRPVPLEIRDNATAPAHQARPKEAAAPAPDQGQKAQEQDARPSKFPNIDTAKNRQDYDITTPKAEGIRLGRDEATGDTVLGTTPPKKTRPVDPYENPPIEVRPILPRR